MIYKCGRWVVSLGTRSAVVLSALTCCLPETDLTEADHGMHGRIARPSPGAVFRRGRFVQADKDDRWPRERVRRILHMACGPSVTKPLSCADAY